MPGVTPPLPEWVYQLIAQIHGQARASASQQQNVVTNLAGQPIIYFGLIPGTNPPAFGLQVMNPTTGLPLAFFGQNSDGTVSLRFFNANGNKVVQVDQTGLSIFDNTGVLQVLLGLLNSSPAIYGLGVHQYGTPAGVLQQYSGITNGAVLNAFSVRAVPWTAFSPTGAVTVQVGPSGIALVTCNGQLSTGVSNEGAFVGVSVDGGTPQQYLGLQESVGTGGVSAQTSSTLPFTGLSAGLHTFQPWYQTTNDGTSTCTFQQVNIVVQPL